MPGQPIDRFGPGARRAFVDASRARSPAWPRAVVLGGAFLMLAGAAYEMYRVLDVGGLTIVEAIVLFFFSVNFAWIALAFMGALAGFAVLLRRRSRPQPASAAPIRGRTAMLMPTYNENPERVFAAVEAMAEGTAKAGGAGIDWFILSDTTDPSVLLAEETALVAIRARLGPAPLVY
jgi:membrane glycosyltransferase